jgi:hypothetical protein
VLLTKVGIWEKFEAERPAKKAKPTAKMQKPEGAKEKKATP